MKNSESIFLICTVGDNPNPIVASLEHWRPERVCFVHTPQTKIRISENIVPKVQEKGLDLDAGRYDLFELLDCENMEKCLEQLRELTPEVIKWKERGSSFKVIVDFTSGTRCMSVSMGLQASRWPCMFSYVGGTERTKGGVGIVIDGKERIVCNANPWDILGYQAIEDFTVLFDQRAFKAAADAVEKAKMNVSSRTRKRELAVLEQFAKAFDAWDRFLHKKSYEMFENVAKSANDLRAALGSTKGNNVLNATERVLVHLAELCKAAPPSRYHVFDLLANAKRRKDEGRFDDAVARLYRAIEAMAQVALKEHGIESTENVPLERIPESLRAEWASQANEGVVTLGLQDAYKLLMSLEDPLGKKFQSLGLNDKKSPLVARNRSILAHGFESVSENAVKQIWKAALSLADIEEQDLPVFPTLR